MWDNLKQTSNMKYICRTIHKISSFFFFLTHNFGTSTHCFLSSLRFYYWLFFLKFLNLLGFSISHSDVKAFLIKPASVLSSKPVIDKVKSKLLMISIQLWLILCSSSTVSFLVFDSFYFYSDCLLHACLGQVEIEKHKFWTCDFNVNLPAWLIEIVPQIITFPSSRNSKSTS